MEAENKYLVMLLLLLVVLLLPPSVDPFSPILNSIRQQRPPPKNNNKNNNNNRRHHHDITNLFSVAVPSSELEKDLTPAERSVTGVVRSCGPAVAYVTSIFPPPPPSSRQKRRGGRGRNDDNDNNNRKDEDSLPEGMSLGTGSGFLVSKEGYVCTNFHVIERAYTIQKTLKDIEESLDKTQQELSKIMSPDLSKSLISFVKEPLSSEKPPEIYVRINSSTRYQKCHVVEVEPDLDLAVLKIENSSATTNNKSSDNNNDDEDSAATSSGSQLDTLSPISFGSSDNLLVGQSVVAIGNPFGLDKTVTTGVVSAVNREFRAGTARTPNNRPIRNAIQTDASINPGNSGGPLLNLKGEVVGINTAIISTSGSSAGIGFAVPGSRLKPVVDRILLDDRVKDGKRPNSGWLGVSVVKPSISATTTPPTTNSTTATTRLQQKNWVTSVEPNSPAFRESVVPLRILDSGCVEFGDAIVAVAGNEVSTSEQLRKELQDRVTGEQVALTLEDSKGTRRVVYVTLEDKPVSDEEENV